MPSQHGNNLHTMSYNVMYILTWLGRYNHSFVIMLRTFWFHGSISTSYSGLLAIHTRTFIQSLIHSFILNPRRRIVFGPNYDHLTNIL